jgi:pilus assembly protein CpaE
VADEANQLLLICADRDAAIRLAGALQKVGYRVVATPYGSAALTRAAEVQGIIIDRVDGAVSAVQAIERLRELPSVGETPILAIAQSDEVDERVALLDAGADDVMAQPLDTGELEARLEVLLAPRRAAAEAAADVESPASVEAATGPTVVVFHSPKGGTGTTTIAVNCAVALASRGDRRVALVDLDLTWGCVAPHLNLRPKSSVVDLARDIAALEDPELTRGYAARHESGVAVYPAPDRPDLGVMITAEQVGDLVGAFGAAYDVVLIDAGSVMDERTLTLFGRATRVAIIVTAEIPTVRSVSALMELVAEDAGSLDTVMLVLNRTVADDTIRTEDLERTLHTSIAAELPYDATAYLKAVNEGVPVVVGSPRSTAAERLVRLASQLTGEPAGTEQAPPADGFRRLSLAGLLRRG